MICINYTSKICECSSIFCTQQQKEISQRPPIEIFDGQLNVGSKQMSKTNSVESKWMFNRTKLQ